MQSKTLYELLTDVETSLSDTAYGTWTLAKIVPWILQGIKSISTYVYHSSTSSITCIAGTTVYDLPVDYKAMLKVEYPAGSSPATYLKRAPLTSSLFAGGYGYYDIKPSSTEGKSSLVLAQTPSAGETITLIYEASHRTDIYVEIEGLSRANPCVVTWTAHDLDTGDYVDIRGVAQYGWASINAKYAITKIDADTFSISFNSSAIATAYDTTKDVGKIYAVSTLPTHLYELLMIYVTWCATRERLMQASQNPDTSTLLLSQYASNADRMWRNYTETANRMAKSSVESGFAHSAWTMDGNDRIY